MKCPNCFTPAYHWVLLKDNDKSDPDYTFYARSFQCLKCTASCSQRVNLGGLGQRYPIVVDSIPGVLVHPRVILLVAGSRSITNADYVKACIDKALLQWNIALEDISFVVNGTAAGVDRLALEWAEEHSLPVRKEPPAWGKLGKPAGAMRNKQMVKLATHIIIIWDGKSPGTLLTRKDAIRMKKQMMEFSDPPSPKKSETVLMKVNNDDPRLLLLDLKDVDTSKTPQEILDNYLETLPANHIHRHLYENNGGEVFIGRPYDAEKDGSMEEYPLIEPFESDQ